MTTRGNQHPGEHMLAHLARMRSGLKGNGLIAEGRIDRMIGMTLEAVGCQAAVGARCDVEGRSGEIVEAEVVGFSGERLFLMPTSDLVGLTPGARVRPSRQATSVEVGNALLGRVIDGAGAPLDGMPRAVCSDRARLTGQPINPLERAPIRTPLDVGVRSINALLTVGAGQRLGLFAGSGVGKSSLLGMMTRNTDADVIVVGLIGERGREVQEFVQDTLGPAGLQRAVIVATPADCSPLMRLHGAWLATSVAENFRDQGKRVLLLMDSLTRFAQAQREIALAIGEPPATKGYPPSVFARLPQLVERAGNGDSGKGSITAFYTVLTEGDDPNDPVADAARAILDGHIVLSREMAESGMYPAIDVEASVSRAMNRIISEDHSRAVKMFRHLYGLYRQNRDFITVGAYEPGNDPDLDRAVLLWPRIRKFMTQDLHQPVSMEGSIRSLHELLHIENEPSGMKAPV
ncbi:MAG: flagellar protein export ATPase FliI [Gammaproteobacteria bacterium]|nr:flagellar protein export ATPase FliI [Gammaproteobacteria bacterium]